jgi:urease accessory protein
VFDGTSRSDKPHDALERANGYLRLRVERSGLAELRQEGAYKARLPRARLLEAVLLNTAGGLTGGDRLRSEVFVGAAARATVTTAACEKIYRSTGPAARVEAHLHVAAGGRLDWLPQETILFDRSSLERRFEIDLAADATLLLVEAVVFGRTARGESVEQGSFRDRWTLRRDGALVFAEVARLDGAIAETLRRPAVLAGGCAAATVLYAAPDAARFLDPLRGALAGAEAGASLRDGVLLTRIAAADGFALRAPLLAAMRLLRDDDVPRVWMC